MRFLKRKIQRAQQTIKCFIPQSNNFPFSITKIEAKEFTKVAENNYQLKIEDYSNDFSTESFRSSASSADYFFTKMEESEFQVKMRESLKTEPESSQKVTPLKIETEDLIKTEESGYQMKIEDYPNDFYAQSSQFSSTSSPIIVKNETDYFFAKVEESELQVKMEDALRYKHENSKKDSKRTPLGPNSRHRSSTKNVAMNYGRAIFSFASSSLALPYLTPRLNQEGLMETEFHSFLMDNKNKIQTINGLRSTLLIKEEDDLKTKSCRRLFQWLGEVFIKCFSVNWIMNGKVSHKMVYLKYRFKMLRRIQNPEKFTYIKERQKKKVI